MTLAQHDLPTISSAELFALSLAGALIPCLLWLWFFYRRDRHDREPKPLILKLFLIGAFPVALAAGFVNAAFAGVVSLGLVAVVVAPLGEETFKYLGAKRGTRKTPAFEEPVDGMVYGVTVGLGFAAAETVDYLIAAYTGVDLWTGEADALCHGFECFAIVAVVRGIGSALVHALCSGIAGYYLSRRVLDQRGRMTAVGGVLLAAAFHGLWNATGLGAGVLVLIVAALVFRRLLRKALARSPHIGHVLLPGAYDRLGQAGAEAGADQAPE